MHGNIATPALCFSVFCQCLLVYLGYGLPHFIRVGHLTPSIQLFSLGKMSIDAARLLVSLAHCVRFFDWPIPLTGLSSEFPGFDEEGWS